jgi:TPP-dependent pyruvate/acetoin dehydrogenase alpha subunit
VSALVTINEPLRIDVCTRTSPVAEQYALLVSIRLFEQSLLDLFSQGALSGTTHTCLGQETVAVGVLSAIDRDRDIVFSNHRGHGHFLAYCGEVERLYLEVMGKPGGVCGGRGGSQHLHYKSFYSNGVQGGIVPVAAGMALAEELKRSGAVAVVFLGDGTFGEGVVYEALNIAALWRLPILFVAELNGYAQSTPSTLQIAGDVAARTLAFGIATHECPTDMVPDVLALTAQAMDEIRAGHGPRCVVVNTYRLAPHSKGDDSRSPEELAAAWSRDPLKRMRAILGDSVAADDIERRAGEMVRVARARALEWDGPALTSR